MASIKTTSRDIRQVNRHTLLRLLYFAGPISRLELSQASCLSPATVTNVTSELLEEGIIVESGISESQGGRPRTILSINTNHGYLIGIDVGETYLHIELFDLILRPIGAFRRTLNAPESQPQPLIMYLLQNLRTLLLDIGITLDSIIDIGIGVPDIVTQSNVVSVAAPGWEWQDVPLGTLLAKHLDVPIYIDNGAKAMALAELWFGAERGCENLAVLLIGTGVGAGLITQGDIYRGTDNSVGEWGHAIVELEGSPCLCGGRGCLEAYIGAPAIIERLRALAPESMLLHSDQMTTIPRIIDAAQHNDLIAQQIIQETIHYLGAGIASLINICNPQLVILGGWVGQDIATHFLPDLHHVIQRYTLKQPQSNIALLDRRQLAQVRRHLYSTHFCEVIVGQQCAHSVWSIPNRHTYEMTRI